MLAAKQLSAWLRVHPELQIGHLPAALCARKCWDLRIARGASITSGPCAVACSSLRHMLLKLHSI